MAKTEFATYNSLDSQATGDAHLSDYLGNKARACSEVSKKKKQFFNFFFLGFDFSLGPFFPLFSFPSLSLSLTHTHTHTHTHTLFFFSPLLFPSLFRRSAARSRS